MDLVISIAGSIIILVIFAAMVWAIQLLFPLQRDEGGSVMMRYVMLGFTWIIIGAPMLMLWFFCNLALAPLGEYLPFTLMMHPQF
jgi:ABC-type amino acid transport system permease subunit